MPGPSYNIIRVVKNLLLPARELHPRYFVDTSDDVEIFMFAVEAAHAKGWHPVSLIMNALLGLLVQIFAQYRIS